MKMNTNTVEIERSGVQRESTFKIAASAKAFEILSSGLYKDPIGAIVRELPCNAYDAHIAAGKADVPFTIHLPTAMEPYFSVSDDGIGLSDNDIQGTPILDAKGNDTGDRIGGLYTTYFESTKTDSNDAIGAFGLGCKSPYSYSEMFQVTSRHEGRRRVYTMFLNENRLPAVALMSDTATDQCNGLEVRVDVKEKDFYTFRDRACTGLRFFKVKPTVTGYHGFKFADLPKGQFSGDGWLVSSKDHYSNGSFTAVMGQVPYRVDVDKLVDHLPVSVLSFVRTLNIIAYFDIGDLEVPPDREEVRYNDKSLLALISRVTEIRKQFTVELEKRVVALEDQTFWAKYQSIRKISAELFGDEKGIVTFLQGETSNIDLLRYCEAVKNRGMLIPTPLAGHIVTMMNNATGRRSLIALKRDKSTTDLIVDEESDQEGAFKTPMIYVTPSPSTLVVYSDVSTAEMKRLRLHMAEKRHTNEWPERVVFIQRLTERRARNVGWEHKLNAKKQDEEFAAICDALGNPKVVRLSTVKNIGASSYNKRPLPIYTYATSKYRRRMGYVAQWNAGFLTDELKDNGGLYFLLDKGKTMKDHTGAEINWANSFTENMNAVVKLINDAQKTKYELKDIVGVSTLTLRRIVGNKKWKNVFEVASSLVNKYNAATTTYRNFLASEDVFGVRDMLVRNDGKFCKDLLKRLHGLDQGSPFREKIGPLVSAYDALIKTDLDIVKCVTLFEEKILRTAAAKTIPLVAHGTSSELQTVYPMLTFVSRIDYNHFNQLFDYVSIIDRSNA